MKYWFSGLAIISLIACQQRQEGQHNDKGTLDDLVGTYEFHKGQDSIHLTLNAKGDTLFGPLQYSFFEKDKNNGIFKGVVKDSILVGTYSFISEGVNSKRETVFGILPQGLIEGFGEVKEVDGAMVFNDISSLRYDHGMILIKNKN